MPVWNQDYIKTLYRFNEKTEKLHSSGFIEQIKAGNSGIKIVAKQGEPLMLDIKSPGEYTEAFVLTLRMFMQNNDTISIGNMSELYERLPISEDKKGTFRKLRRQLNSFLDSPSMIQLNKKQFTNRELLDIMLYGDLAHINPEKRALLEQMQAFPPFFAIAKVNFEGILITFFGLLWAVRALNYKALTEINPNDANVWYNMGVILSEEGNLNEALKAYEKAIEIDPQDYRSWNNKGSILRQLGKYNEVLESYDKAIKINPNDPIPYHNKGFAFLHWEKYPEALRYFDEALKRDPNYTDALVNKAACLHKLGKTDEALEHIARALQLKSDEPHALNELAIILAEQKMHSEAEYIFRKVLQLMPDNPSAIANVGQVLYGQQRFQEALNFYNEALRRRPNNALILIKRAATLIKLKRYDDALNDCERVITLDPTVADAYYNKACIKAKVSNEEETFVLLKKAFELDSSLRAHAKEDPDLQNVRERPEFRELVEPTG